MDLTSFRTLGRSGLIVSPMALGTMTFGAARWGSDEAGSRAVFDAYVEAGGNMVDTADVYSGGRSEEMIGGFVAERKLRERLVIATKAGFSRAQGVPHAGGNGAKNIHAALEGSLRRLNTDYVDLFWLHAWDQVTPAEEALETLVGLVRAGRIRYFGLSNAPAWYVARMCTLAGAHGVPGPVALQLAYSLIERGIEREHLPAARAFGLGVQPWSPLGGGFLSGRYRREAVAQRPPPSPQAPDGAAGGEADPPGDGRLDGPNPFGASLFTERNWNVLDALRSVAAAIGRSPAQVALAWAASRPAVGAVLMGASRAEQVAPNVAALGIELSSEANATLDAASALAPEYPSTMFTPQLRRMVFGGAEVTVEGG